MSDQYNFDIRLIFATLNGKVSAAIYHILDKAFKENSLDLTPEQWTILLYLWDKEGIRQQDLCDATFKDKPSMTRLLDTMERQNLVVRINYEVDRRTNLIYLTRRGKDIEATVREVVNNTLKDSLQGVSAEELEICQSVLKQIFKNATNPESVSLCPSNE